LTVKSKCTVEPTGQRAVALGPEDAVMVSVPTNRGDSVPSEINVRCMVPVKLSVGSWKLNVDVVGTEVGVKVPPLSALVTVKLEMSIVKVPRVGAPWNSKSALPDNDPIFTVMQLALGHPLPVKFDVPALALIVIWVCAAAEAPNAMSIAAHTTELKASLRMIILPKETP